MKDPMKMLKQVQQMQDRMTKIQEELEHETVEASSGGGVVRAVATGTQKVVSVSIDASVKSGACTTARPAFSIESYFSSGFLPAFKLSKFRIVLKTSE